MSYLIITQSNSNLLSTQNNTTFSIREEIDLGGNNIIISENSTLKFEGGYFKNCGIIDGRNTTVEANLNQIFSGNSLAFDGTWQTKKTFPQWFGVKGNNTDNDSTALQFMIDFINLLNGDKEFYIPENLFCKIDSTLDLSGIENIDIKGRISTNDNDINIQDIENLNTEIKIGTTSNGSKPINVFISYIKGCVVTISGTVHSNITINSAPKLKIYGDGSSTTKYSVAYNRFYLGAIKVLNITCTDTTIPGWVNENKFFGGNFKNITIDGSYPCNNNIFYATMLEDFTGDFQMGYSNYFYDVRFEGSLDLLFEEEVYDTRFYKSYHPYSPEFFKKRNFRLLGEASYNVTDKGVLNGIIHQVDLIYKDKTVFEMNKNTKPNVTIFTIDGDNLTTPSSGHPEFYDSGKFKFPIHPETGLPQPISIKIFSDEDFADARLQLFDINGILIDQTFFNNSTIAPSDLVNIINLGGQWKGYNNLNWYQFSANSIPNLTPSSSQKAIFPIFPKNIAYYAQLKIRISPDLPTPPVTFNNFSIVISESKDNNTVVGDNLL